MNIEKDEFEISPEIEDHLETYWDKFDEWNSGEPYKPSFLFGFRESIFRFISKYINLNLDEDEILKELMFYTIGTVAVVAVFSILYTL